MTVTGRHVRSRAHKVRQAPNAGHYEPIEHNQWNPKVSGKPFSEARDGNLQQALDVAQQAIETSHFAYEAFAPNVNNSPEDASLAEVIIDDTGLTVLNGKLFLIDEFGDSVLTASGFGGSWDRFILDGLYNSQFRSGEDSSGPFPFWLTAADTGLVWERVTVDSFPVLRCRATVTNGTAKTASLFQAAISAPAGSVAKVRLIAAGTEVVEGAGFDPVTLTQIRWQSMNGFGPSAPDTSIFVVNYNWFPVATGFAVTEEWTAPVHAWADNGDLFIEFEFPSGTTAGQCVDFYGVSMDRHSAPIARVTGTDPEDTQYEMPGTLTITGDLTVEGNTQVVDLTAADVDVAGDLLVAAKFQPSAVKGSLLSIGVGADQDNWNPSGLDSATILRAVPTAARNITGIVAPPQGDGRMLWLMNAGGFALTLKQNSGSSSAGNKFGLPSSVDFVIPERGGALLIYDGASAVWRVIAKA